MNKRYISTSEAAKWLGVSRVTIFNRIRSGDIKAEKVGRNFIIDKEDLIGSLDGTLTEAKKLKIEEAVKKVVREYGKTLKLLGKE